MNDMDIEKNTTDVSLDNNMNRHKIIADLHPLAIMSISDHFTRWKEGGIPLNNDNENKNDNNNNNNDNNDTMLIGLLFGRAENNTPVIYDAVDCLARLDNNNNWCLNKHNVQSTKELFLANFVNYDLLGWYAIDNEVTDDHLNIHREMLEFNESPLFLLMKSIQDMVGDNEKTLPILLFESIVQIKNDKPTLCFESVDYQMKSTQSEQISMDHISKVIPTDSISLLEIQSQSLLSSMNTLSIRITDIMEYLTKIKEEEIAPNPFILRKISKICSRLNTIGNNEIEKTLQKELNDSLIVTCLASMSKTASSLNELSNDFLFAFNKKNDATDMFTAGL